MKEMRDRVRRTARDLSTLHTEIAQALQQHSFQKLEEILTPEVTAEFKSAVDAMRHLLYEGGASAGGSFIEKVEAIMKRKIPLRDQEKA